MVPSGNGHYPFILNMSGQSWKSTTRGTQRRLRKTLLTPARSGLRQSDIVLVQCDALPPQRISCEHATWSSSSPHFSPNRVHWGSDSERIVLQPRFFSNP